MKEIAIIHYTVPPVVGGIESIIYHQIRLLNAAGYIVRVIAGSGDESYYEASFHHQIDFFAVPEINPFDPKVFTAMRELAGGDDRGAFQDVRDLLIERLMPLLQDVQVCIVHNLVTTNQNLPLTAALHKLAGEIPARWVSWSHEFLPDQKSSPNLEYPWNLLTTVWPNTRYIVSTPQQRSSLAQTLHITPDSIQLAPVGIDESAFLKLEESTRHLIQELNLLEAAPLLLMPCQISPRKNIEFALDVVHHLCKTYPKTTLLITGSPSLDLPADMGYLEALEARRLELGLTENVHLLYEYGEHDLPMHVSEPMLSDLYQLSDLLFCPACIESYDPVLLAAGLLRLPIFTVDDPMMQGQTSSLTELFTLEMEPQEVADRIADRIQTDRSYHLRRRILSKYTWKSIFEKVLEPLIEESAI